MNRQQIENIYKANGLSEYKLTTIEELQKVHGVNALEVKGYSDLKEENRELYLKFVLNYFNAYGLETRATMYPLGIYYVEETKFLGKNNETDDYYVGFGCEILIIKADGSTELLRKSKDENHNLKSIITENKNYLRFEYQINDRQEWQHVINEHEWY
ncbi:MAG: hypothetical protein RR806_01515 [Oscillospiraceae bacterium]